MSAVITRATKSEYLTLLAEIRRLNYFYYERNTSRVTDEVYDQKFSRLKEIEELHPDWVNPHSPTQVVGGNAPSEQQFTHPFNMLSLENTYENEFVYVNQRRIVKKLEVFPTWVAEPKFDGIAFRLYYRDGILVTGATRGDGMVGQDRTLQALLINDIPKVLKNCNHKEVAIDGELCMTRNDFFELNARQRRICQPPFATPRHATGGTMGLKDPEEFSKRTLRFMAYEARDWQGNFLCDLHSATWTLLEDLGFNIAEQRRMSVSITGLIEFQNTLSDMRETCPFDMDGVVYKVNDVAHREILGYTSKGPNWAFAHKFKAMKKRTVIRDVEWSISAQGELSAKAMVDPVELKGVTVSSVSMPSISNLKEMRKNDVVMVSLQGDAFPVISGVLKEERKDVDEQGELEFTLPVVCPFCKSPLAITPTRIACVSETCPEQLVKKVWNLVSKKGLDFKNLSRSTIRTLVEQKSITSIADIYTLTPEKLVRAGFNEHRARAFFEFNKRSKEVTLTAFLTGLNAPGVSSDLYHKIGQRFHTHPLAMAVLRISSSTYDSPETLRSIFVQDLRIKDAVFDRLMYFLGTPAIRRAIQSMLSNGLTFK